jgi:hypothetical protein
LDHRYGRCGFDTCVQLPSFPLQWTIVESWVETRRARTGGDLVDRCLSRAETWLIAVCHGRRLGWSVSVSSAPREGPMHGLMDGLMGGLMGD